MGRLVSIFLLFATAMSIYEVFTENDYRSDVEDKNANDEKWDASSDDRLKHHQDDLGDDNFGNEINDDPIEIRNFDENQQEKLNKISNKAYKMPMDFPPVKFLFCVSCGYRQAFDQFANFLREKYPGIEVYGENYPPSILKTFAAQFAGISKILLIVIIIMGRDPFQILGMQTPQFYNWLLSNKLSSCLMIFLLSNSIEAMLMSTGAFEIYLGNDVIWSKLESGRVPTPAELESAIDSHMSLRGGIGRGLNSDVFEQNNLYS